MHDLILIHPPSVFDFRELDQFHGPISQVIPSGDQFEMYPMGFTSIAAYLTENNYTVRIVNLARRMVADRSFDATRHLRRLRARVFGIDLHWLPHAQGALAIARLLKYLHPEATVLIGGLSASYFHETLARDPAVDFVIRGDSTEEPIRQLLSALRERRPLDTVANLTWKKDGAVITNALTEVPTDLDRIDIPAYRYMVRSVFNHGRLADAIPYEGWLEHPLTVVLNARGCVLDCAVCGGSRSAYRRICGRARPAFRSPERLVEDLRVIRSFSRSPVFMIHDPRIGGTARARRIFELLARERMPNELVMELFYPARRPFFEMVRDSVPRWSLQLTLESQDELLRRANGKFACPNSQVEDTIGLALEHGCRNIDVFFMVGVPGQTFASALEIGRYCEALLERFGAQRRVRPFVAPLAPFLDPGSRAFEEATFGYRVPGRSLADHERALLEQDWTRALTFESDAMTRSELVEATYAVTEQLNDLNLRFGLIGPDAHATVARTVRVARLNANRRWSSHQQDAWLFAKDQMSWPGPEGIRPTVRLAWTLFTGAAEEFARILARAAGRYDTHVATAAGEALS